MTNDRARAESGANGSVPIASLERLEHVFIIVTRLFIFSPAARPRSWRNGTPLELPIATDVPRAVVDAAHTFDQLRNRMLSAFSVAEAVGYFPKLAVGCGPQGQSHLCGQRLVLGWRREKRSARNSTGGNGVNREWNRSQCSPFAPVQNPSNPWLASLPSPGRGWFLLSGLQIQQGGTRANRGSNPSPLPQFPPVQNHPRPSARFEWNKFRIAACGLRTVPVRST
jgi:hypothetical protein